MIYLFKILLAVMVGIYYPLMLCWIIPYNLILEPFYKLIDITKKRIENEKRKKLCE
jgi:uncharacterized oligopeptide transporter (OPT) family protein